MTKDKEACNHTFHRLGGIDDCPLCNPTDKEAMEKAAREYRPDVPIDAEGPLISKFANSLHREVRVGFEAGWQSCLQGPAVMALVKALTFLANDGHLKTDGNAPSDVAKRALAEFEEMKK